MRNSARVQCCCPSLVVLQHWNELDVLLRAQANLILTLSLRARELFILSLPSDICLLRVSFVMTHEMSACNYRIPAASGFQAQNKLPHNQLEFYNTLRLCLSHDAAGHTLSLNMALTSGKWPNNLSTAMDLVGQPLLCSTGWRNLLLYGIIEGNSTLISM